ncbi:SEN1 [Candida oxycetoniae]|uniref:SEN1 n=1 Tax=Candida oxycetoniae TaxID=497107 RepID=A0AAI9SXT0_9ASCO|nr:SEN1 [Candida oxycetoniae]KAI3405053.2 SEN1 [Candida oxycetoniae]
MQQGGLSLDEDKAYKEVTALIFSSLDGASDAHELALKKSHEYLVRCSNNSHWFCNEQIYPISIYSLILFSFPNNALSPSLRPGMATSLKSCQACIKYFNIGKAELRLNFATKKLIPIENVQQFTNAINEWEIEVLLPLFDSVYKQVTQEDQAPDSKQLEICFHWVLNNPQILRQFSSIRDKFGLMVSKVRVSRTKCIPKDLLPGLIYLLFEASGDQKLWAIQWVNELRQTRVFYNEKELSEAVILEFSVHLYRIEDPSFFNDRNAVKFWEVFNILVDFIDDKALVNKLNAPKDIHIISQHKNLRLYPVMRLLGNSLMSHLNEPLPVMLQVFSKFLSRLKSQFWATTPQIHPIELLERIITNPSFYRQLERGSMEQTTINDWTLDDLLTWMVLLIDTVHVSQKQIACIKLSSFLLKYTAGGSETVNDTRAQREAYLRNFGFSLLNQSFHYDHDSTDNDKYVELLKVRDYRANIEGESETLVKMAMNTSEEGVINEATALLIKCLKYDILILVQSSILLSKEKVPVLYDTFPVLWNALNKSKLNSNVSLSKEIIKCFKNLNSVIYFNPLKNGDTKKEITEAKKQHNNSVGIMVKYINSILGNISLTPPSRISDIINDTDCLTSLWSCIFFPPSNQPALDLINEVYDGTGRFELVEEGLRLNLKSTLVAINFNLKALTQLKAFEPSPKAVRVLMDVIKALADPISPVLLSPKVSHAHSDIVVFWKDCLLFLVMLYDQAITWAGRYHMHELVEFTRDTLDLSHLMLESFRIFSDGISPYEGKNCRKMLFASFMDAFNSMIAWLRLGDVPLLNSCVDLVLKVFDLAAEQNFSIEDTVLEKFAKFGVKAKKFNNKLSESQRSQLLSKAKEFNSTLVEKIVDEANENRERKNAALAEENMSKATTTTTAAAAVYGYKNQVVPAASSMGEQKQSSFYQKSLKKDVVALVEEHGSKYASRRDREKSELIEEVAPSSRKTVGKQQTLGMFARASSEPPVAPPMKSIKGTNSLDTIRKDLKVARAAAPKIEKPPAPSRPAGYNSKKAPPVIGRSLNTLKSKKIESDSSEEDDDDIDMSDLFVEKKKKGKIVEIDLNGREITHLNRINEKKAFEKEKLEKERMSKRLNVNLKPLYLNILRWNYNSKSEFPTRDQSIYEKVCDSYDNVKDYVKTMEPLLMLECWQAIQSSRDTVMEVPFELVIGSRTSVDGFFEVYTSISKKTIEDRRLNLSDLIVLACSNEAIVSPAEQRSFFRLESTPTCLAKITSINSANPEYADVTIRVYPSGPIIGALTPKSNILGMKVMQMVTVEREFSSLRGLEYYDLASAIISARPNPPKEVNIEELEDMYKVYDVNKSQARAIKGTFESEGFSLIQGPPGTGKTKTILGIVGYALSHKKNNKIIEMPSRKNLQQPSENAKILICAPSNAAVDELVLRLRNGVKNSKGEHMDLKVVRLGRSDAINAAVKDLTLEELVEKELQSKQVDVQIDPTIRTEHSKKVKERDQIRKRLSTETLSPKEIEKLEERLREVNRERSELAKKLDDQRERSSIAFRTREIGRKNIQTRILDSAQVLCATLSGSAHELIANLSVKFDQVIIDEACQCLELSAIIPLRYGCKKCIMVGDPNQLPPTVLSKAASSYNYEQSLFVRMQKNYPDSVYLLNVQYRMHPQISQFPSREFYQSKLADGPDMEIKNKRSWHEIMPLTPYRFFDIVGRHEKNELTRSLFNTEEANICLQLVCRLIETIPQQHLAGRIGIISPYKEQIRTIKDVFVRRFGRIILSEIDFNTVDGFQGQEKEIIIMSCVRASPDGNVGFLSDVRRMNVALTRARTTLWILGNRTSLSRNKVWKSLLDDAEKRNAITNAYSGFLAQNSFSSTFITTGKRTSDEISENTFSVKKPKMTNVSTTSSNRQLNKVNNKSSISSSSSTLSDNGGGRVIRPTSSGKIDMPLNKLKAASAAANNSNNNNNNTNNSNQFENEQNEDLIDVKMRGGDKKKNDTPPKILKPTSSGTLPKRPPNIKSPGMVLPPKPKSVSSTGSSSSSSIFIPRGPKRR